MPVDDGLPEVDRWISLAPPAASPTASREVVDGEQAYALYTLTEQVDDLAMACSRSAYEAMASTGWKPILTYRDSDLKPLVVNRLFRGFFLDRTRIFLGVQKILEAERPQTVVLCVADSASRCLAQAACAAAAVESIQHWSPPMRRRRVRLPGALGTFVRDIAAPALKHPFASPRAAARPVDVPHLVFIERQEMAIQMAARAFDALRCERDVAITIVHFDPDRSPEVYPAARYVQWSAYQNLGSLTRLLAFQVRVARGGPSTMKWTDPVLRQVGPYILRFVRQVALPSIVHTIEIIRRIAAVERPDLLVVVDETGLLGKAVAIQGRSLGLPTLNIQHGIRADSPWIEDQLFDRFAVFGPSTVEVFAGRGNDPSIFVPTGAPRYDPLFRREGIKPHTHVAAELGLDPNRPIVTFASQRAWGRMTPAVKRETLLAVLRASQIVDAQLVVKMRHGQSDYIPSEAIREPEWEHVKVTSDYDLYDLLNASDVVITAYSTVGLEAIALDRPLLIVNLTGQPDPIPYAQEGVAIGVYDADQVEETLVRLLRTHQPNPQHVELRQRFIRRHLTSDDGHSAQRVACLMSEMIENSQEGR